MTSRNKMKKMFGLSDDKIRLAVEYAKQVSSALECCILHPRKNKLFGCCKRHALTLFVFLSTTPGQEDPVESRAKNRAVLGLRLVRALERR